MISSSSFTALQNGHSIARACSQCATALAAFFNSASPAALAASTQASEHEPDDTSRACTLRCTKGHTLGRGTRKSCAWRTCKGGDRLRDRQFFLCPNSLPRRSATIPAACTCRAGLRDRATLLLANPFRREVHATSRGEAPATNSPDAGERPRTSQDSFPRHSSAHSESSSTRAPSLVATSTQRTGSLLHPRAQRLPCLLRDLDRPRLLPPPKPP